MRYSESPFSIWNRKLHYYVGLYLLLFVWIFSVSGLIINHPGWTFASSFWDTRKQEHYQKPLHTVSGATDLDRARDVLGQLGLAGEIDWPNPRQKPNHLAFRAGRPGRLYEIDADLARGTANVNRTTVNGWGALRMLHTFTGVHSGDPNRRDWLLTWIWSGSMDAVAIGLAFLVGSGVWVWLRSGRRRLGGLLSLAAGIAVCALLLFA